MFALAACMACLQGAAFAAPAATPTPAPLIAGDAVKPEILETTTVSSMSKNSKFVKVKDNSGFYLWQPIQIDEEVSYIIGMCQDNSMMLSNESDTQFGVQQPHPKGATIRTINLGTEWKKGVKAFDCDTGPKCAKDCGDGECVEAAQYLFGMDDADICKQAKQAGMCNYTTITGVCFESCGTTAENCFDRLGTQGGCKGDDDKAMKSLLKRLQETPNEGGCSDAQDLCHLPPVNCLCSQTCSISSPWKDTPTGSAHGQQFAGSYMRDMLVAQGKPLPEQQQAKAPEQQPKKTVEGKNEQQN